MSDNSDIIDSMDTLRIEILNRCFYFLEAISRLEDRVNQLRRNEKMYIAENDLKARILTGQLEILDEVLTELRRRNETAIMIGHPFVTACTNGMIIDYSRYRSELAREKRKLETGK